MKKVTDVSRGARETKVDLSQFGFSEPDTHQTRGFWLFWLRPEGGVYRPGFNLTICRGVAIALIAFGKKYRLRYRKDISPRILWSVGGEA